MTRSALVRLVLIATIGAGVAAPVVAQAGPPAAASGVPASPETVAIVDEGAAGFSVRHFPTRLRFYTFDKDMPGRSACVDACAAVWPPLRDKGATRPMGDWSLVPRPDGNPQWAYKGAPIYVHYHDDPDAPSGDGAEGGAWHIVPNIPKAAARPAERPLRASEIPPG